LLAGLGEKLANHFPALSIYYAAILNTIIVYATTVLLFGGIFKVLPDAKIKWKHVLAGAIFTAVLFLLGKWAIGIYLGRSKVNTTYGAAGGIMLWLLWVYYSAIILYFGAEFTRHFAQWRGSRIFPTEYAVWVESIEIERKDKLPENPALVDDDAKAEAT
jgi:membrane protein